MTRMLFRVFRRVFVWGLAAVGLVAVVLVGLIAQPLSRPAPLVSISQTVRSVDRSDMPPLEHFQARDGTFLAFRHYPARVAGVETVAVLVHGSAGSSTAVHQLAKALAQHGVETFAPDIRGHGASGTRGDIGYGGQLQDDLADLVATVRLTHPTAPLVLLGHSAGGGFALRMAGSSIQQLFTRTILLAPYLGYKETTSRSDGGWAAPDIPRIVGLMALQRMHIACCESLPVIAFAVPPHSAMAAASHYSYRLLFDFGAGLDFRESLAAAMRPVSIYSGMDDELMRSDNYQATVGDKVKVTLLPGVNHMGIVSDPAATARIAEDIAHSDVKS